MCFSRTKISLINCTSDTLPGDRRVISSCVPAACLICPVNRLSLLCSSPACPLYSALPATQSDESILLLYGSSSAWGHLSEILRVSSGTSPLPIMAAADAIHALAPYRARLLALTCADTYSTLRRKRRPSRNLSSQICHGHPSASAALASWAADSQLFVDLAEHLAPSVACLFMLPAPATNGC